MLAETKGKISRTGSNLTDRLEDNLTGNVFGSLRYIPFSKALREVLANGVYPKGVGEDIRQITTDFWADKIEFWPYDPEGEIDALLEFPDMRIGIEVKYKSGLSSDDGVSNDQVKQKEDIEKSINQLARESRILLKRGQKKHKVLLFIADRKSCKEVYEDVSRRDIIEEGVTLGYLSWQEFLVQLKKLHLTDPYHNVIIQDLIVLLTRKGFEDFTNMDVESPQPINEHDYFKFKVENKPTFSFETNLKISEGLYYEFN